MSWLRSHASYIVVWQKVGGDDKKRAQTNRLSSLHRDDAPCSGLIIAIFFHNVVVVVAAFIWCGGMERCWDAWWCGCSHMRIILWSARRWAAMIKRGLSTVLLSSLHRDDA